jgi:prepilin-type N-terminal cleavage/methylation domain-containing protein
MLPTSAIGDTVARATPGGPRTAAGFTLIEVLVVLLLLSLVAAAFPLALDRLAPSRRYAKDVEIVAAQIRDARRLARRCARTVALVLAPVPGRPPRPSAVRRCDAPLALASGLSITCTEVLAGRPITTVSFHADGSTSGVACRLSDRVYESTLSVALLSGRISVSATAGRES